MLCRGRIVKKARVSCHNVCLDVTERLNEIQLQLVQINGRLAALEAKNEELEHKRATRSRAKSARAPGLFTEIGPAQVTVKPNVTPQKEPHKSTCIAATDIKDIELLTVCVWMPA